MRVEFVFADYLAKRIARSDALGDLTNASAHPLARPGLALVLGGFAWGLPARTELSAALRVLVAGWPELLTTRTILLEQLPNHFPGGHYRGLFRPYPPAATEVPDAVCDLRATVSAASANRTARDAPTAFSHYFTMDDLPAFNAMLAEVAAAHRLRPGLLPLAALYNGRGDAHIGTVRDRGKHGRDCLHYCVAPGVLEGAARAILAVVGRARLAASHAGSLAGGKAQWDHANRLAPHHAVSEM